MIRVAQILEFLESIDICYEFKGNKEVVLEGFSTLKNYKENTVTWAKNELAYQYSFQDKLLVIAQEGLDIKAQNVIFSKESKRAFFAVVEYMAKKDQPVIDNAENVGVGTVIGENVRIGKDVKIGSNCVIDGNITIGDNTRIWNNVTIINNVAIGKHCEIQSGCVIGHDGFAWNENEAKEKFMIKHFGGVEIKDHVYMGPNCIVDRGEIDNTMIGSGSKIDANCFIAHNVILGENVILITGSRLYGSVELGKNSYVASATVRNQCKVGSDAFIGIGSVVVKNVLNGETVAGVPAKVIKRGE